MGTGRRRSGGSTQLDGPEVSRRSLRSLLDHRGALRSLLDHRGALRSLLDHRGALRSLFDHRQVLVDRRRAMGAASARLPACGEPTGRAPM